VRGADVVVAVSDAVAVRLPTLKPMVVHSGVEPSNKVYPEIKLGRKNIIIGACRIVFLKGLLDLIGAAASLHVEFPRLRAPVSNERMRREKSADSALLTMSSFEVSSKSLGPHCKIRTFALPSLREDLPISVLEAMAEGLPVVSISVGGLPELVAHGHTGYLLPPLERCAQAGP
jgi:glycosyltransferase involved in cell wall biosynthesis